MISTHPPSSVALLLDRQETQLSAEGFVEMFRASGIETTIFDVRSWREPLELQLPWWDRGVLRHDRIVAIGGDVTFGLAGRVAAESGLPLALIPGGESNVFAYEKGIPIDIAKSAPLAAGTATRATRIATAGHQPIVHQASLIAPWALRRKPYPARIWFDEEEMHDGDTIALQVLPPPLEDPDGELIARLTIAGGDGQIERRCSVVEAHLPLDRLLTVDGEDIPIARLADGAITRFAVTEPFELVVPG